MITALYLVVGAVFGGLVAVAYYEVYAVPYWRRHLDAARQRIAEQNDEIRSAASLLGSVNESINSLTATHLAHQQSVSHRVH